MGTTVVKNATRLFVRESKNRFDGDLIREISELITNSIDSYARLVNNGEMPEESERVVFVKLCKPQRKDKEKYTIQVIDYAEGMSCETLKSIFAVRGDDNNNGANNKRIRGLFGLGASDCMSASAIEGKSAEYLSFKDEKLTKLRFSITADKNEMEFTDHVISQPKELSDLRKKYGIYKNGTVAIFGVPDSVIIPSNIKDFKHSLETTYLLRNLLCDERNVVYLEAYGEKIRLSSKEYQLKNPFLEEPVGPFEFKKEKFSGKIEFYKNEDKIANPTDILVQDDRGNLYDNQMFGFAKAQGSEHLSGILTIDNFWDLLKKFLDNGEELIKDDRTGFDISKKFGKTLSENISSSISKALSCILNEEGSKNIALNQTKNYRDFLKFLNKDLNSTRTSIIGGGKVDKKPPLNCIEFARNRASITSGHGYDLKLYINKSMILDSKTIEIECAGNFNNIKTIDKIEINDDTSQEMIVKSVAINAIEKTIVPVIISAKYNGYITSCELSVIDEEIIYPENGIEFEKHSVTFTPDVNHKKIRLYFDTSSVNSTDIINITNDSNGKLTCSTPKTTIESGVMITENIGFITLNFSGGELKDNYTVIASYANGNDKLDVTINASIHNEHGSVGDISDYEIDPRKFYIEQKSYYDLSDGKIKIVQGNPINDTFIRDYNSKVSGKALKYIISLVCYEAGKLFASREVSNGHIHQNDFSTYEQTIESKQKEYYEKYLSLDSGE